jgi:hypothetical protein
MNAPARNYAAKPAVRADEPLLIGMVGPPGGGKTFSALRLAKGMKALRGGDIIVIDTEGGRARKYADQFEFLHVDFEPPHQPHAFLDAIQAQLARKPACIVVDSMSDEHEGHGGYLEWHDEMVPKMGGNEWAAWAKPKASRKRLINGLLHIRVPLIFTFRAREKTKQQDGRNGKKEVVNIGWMPVAPLEIVHSLDLTCILPPRADGVPVWESSKIGEDFIIKLPNFLAPLITKDAALDERTGRALAEWARGGQSPQPVEASQGPQDAANDGEPAVQRHGATPAAGSPEVLSLEDEAREQAMRGAALFDTYWQNLDQDERNQLKPIGKELRRLMDEAG